MSEHERTGFRDLDYSRWHRTASIKRFLPEREAYELAMIDIDGCEYCRWCKAPLALIEVKRRGGNRSCTVTRNLANEAGVPGFIVTYDVDDGDIREFRWQRIAPDLTPILIWSPHMYASWLWSLRQAHRASCPTLNKYDTR